MFDQMVDSIREDTVKMLLMIEVRPVQPKPAQQAQPAQPQAAPAAQPAAAPKAQPAPLGAANPGSPSQAADVAALRQKLTARAPAPRAAAAGQVAGAANKPVRVARSAATIPAPAAAASSGKSAPASSTTPTCTPRSKPLPRPGGERLKRPCLAPTKRNEAGPFQRVLRHALGGTHFCAQSRDRNSFPLIFPWGQNLPLNPCTRPYGLAHSQRQISLYVSPSIRTCRLDGTFLMVFYSSVAPEWARQARPPAGCAALRAGRPSLRPSGGRPRPTQQLPAPAAQRPAAPASGCGGAAWPRQAGGTSSSWPEASAASSAAAEGAAGSCRAGCGPDRAGRSPCR